MCLYVSLSLFVCDFGETVIHVTNMIKSEFAIYHWQCAYGGSYCDFSSSNKFMYSDAIITRKNLPTHSFWRSSDAHRAVGKFYTRQPFLNDIEWWKWSSVSR